MGYKVKKGDGWYKIAKTLGVDVNELLKANNATLDTLLHPDLELQTAITEKPVGVSGLWGINRAGAAKEWSDQQVKALQNLAQKAEENAKKDLRSRKDKIYKGLPDRTYQELLEKDKIQALQSLLRSLGYGIGKFGADGIIGKATKAALAAAEKDGWVVLDNKLTKKQSSEESSKKLSNENPGFFSDALNFLGRHNAFVRPFVRHPYQGSEKKARELGYKYYTTNGFTRHPVSYSVTEQSSPLSRALALIDAYGITEELVRDKSPFGTLVYEYSPGYGYSLLRMGENLIRGNKVRENGKRNTKEIKTPVADRITSWLANVSDKVGAHNFASDLRESITYQINESPARNDFSNFYFGYPMNGKTLRVSPYTETGKGNKPDQGYFMEFAYDSNIWEDPSYNKALPGGRGVTATGENMGTWGASIDNQGRKAYYDKWDINPLTHIPGLEGLPNINSIGTSFELYGKQKR